MIAVAIALALLGLLWHWERSRNQRRAFEAECVQRLTEAVREARRAKSLDQLRREGEI